LFAVDGLPLNEEEGRETEVDFGVLEKGLESTKVDYHIAVTDLQHF
jgi:hypothetical protein